MLYKTVIIVIIIINTEYICTKLEMTETQEQEPNPNHNPNPGHNDPFTILLYVALRVSVAAPRWALIDICFINCLLSSPQPLTNDSHTV